MKDNPEHRALRRIGMVHGTTVFAFPLLSVLVSALLVLIPGFRELYLGNAVFASALDTVYSVLIIGLPFFLAYLFLRKKKMLGSLPLGTPYEKKSAVLLVVIGLFCCLAGSYVTGIFSSVIESLFGVTFVMPETNDAPLTTLPMILLAVLQTACIPAFVEEFAIRGVVMQSLRKYGDKFAIVMSAVVFALMHGNMVQIPFAFIAGLAIGYAVMVTGSMWVGVAIHFLNNLVAVGMQIAMDNFSTRTENVIMLCIMLTVFALGAVCIVLYLKNYARVPLAKGKSELSSSEKNTAYIWNVPMMIAIVALVIQTLEYVEF